jgi:hypothetical protein
MTRTLLIGVLIAVASATGCSTTPTKNRRGIERDKDLLYAEGGIERRLSPICTTPRTIPIHVAFRGSDARGQLLTESIDPGRIAAQSCRECFVGSSNYVVINREMQSDVAAEQSRGSAAATAPSDFLVVLTVGMVEREIRADGSTGEWRFVIGIEDTQRQRQGAVEVFAEVISIRDNRTRYSKRAYGLLDEIEQTKGGHWMLGSKQESTTSKTTLSDGIREASRELAREIDAFFESYLSELGIR